MFHHLSLTALFTVLVSGGTIWAQIGEAPRIGRQPALGNAGLWPNSFEPSKPVALPNRITQPVAMSPDAQAVALANLDRSIAQQIADLAKKLDKLLPDELTVLTKTTGWKTADQQALVGALRAGDPTGVYEAWVKGNPLDTAGAELAARQTDAKRLMSRLIQAAEKNPAALQRSLSDFDDALSKVSASTPSVSQLADEVRTLKTWIQARKLVESAIPGKGTVARLPTGDDVTLIFDPSLAVGTAIVLSDHAMLIGHDGHASLMITKGNAAEALGLPIVSGAPLASAGGPELTDGVVILNTAFGTTGSAADPFNLGRTTTHEIGHFLNLRHIWGDLPNCNGDDLVDDTPGAEKPNFKKPTWPHVSCSNGPNGDMFMNYMDYVDDDSMFMFTPGQVARMQATLDGPRKGLVS